MRIDRILFLAAGFGSRMGPIGEFLPKPLWPIFQSTLLQILIDYYQQLQPSQLFVNTHHLHDQMSAYLRDQNIIVLHEKEILDVGGAIYNLANLYGYEGNLLVVNTDQICIGAVEYIQSLQTRNPIHLIAQRVNKQSNLNEIILDQNKLIDIKPPSKNNYLTYSGSSLIKLELLEHKSGSHSFFKSIADFYKKDVFVTEGIGCEYFDFGTERKYFNLITNIKKPKLEVLKRFLTEYNGFDESYFSNSGVISKAGNQIKGKGPAIVLDSSVKEVQPNYIYYQGIQSKIDRQ